MGFNLGYALANVGQFLVEFSQDQMKAIEEERKRLLEEQASQKPPASPSANRGLVNKNDISTPPAQPPVSQTGLQGSSVQQSVNVGDGVKAPIDRGAALREARNAYARGAPLSAIMARLAQYGIRATEAEITGG